MSHSHTPNILRLQKYIFMARGTPSPEGCEPIIWQFFFSENCIKVKKFWPKAQRGARDAPPDPPQRDIHQFMVALRLCKGLFTLCERERESESDIAWNDCIHLNQLFADRRGLFKTSKQWEKKLFHCDWVWIDFYGAKSLLTIAFSFGFTFARCE